MQKIAIVYKRSTQPEALRLATDLSQWLEERGVEVFCQENLDRSGFCCGYESLDIPEDVQAVLVLGGDGTLLSVARSLEHRSTPLVGVNLGGLGFLTEVTREACCEELEHIFDGNYEIEERMRLKAIIMRGDQVLFQHSVLNDVVINKGALARIVDLRTTIDGHFLTLYRADGLIVSSPTGSTAYNLSAGGPIVYPTVQTIILTPICPFTLTNRPIVLPAEATIQIELDESAQDVTLTCDGQVGCEMAYPDRLIITKGENSLRLIKTPSIDYFEILRTKLRWGQP
jgi:NAD+ kinase